MTNKESAVEFLKMVSLGQVQSAFDQFIDHQFIHHNQYFKGDRESLLQAMLQAQIQNPTIAIEVKHVYVDQETVIVHSLVQKQKMAIAVVHIFRFAKNKVIELWDLGQAIDPNSPNQFGLF